MKYNYQRNIEDSPIWLPNECYEKEWFYPNTTIFEFFVVREK